MTLSVISDCRYWLLWLSCRAESSLWSRPLWAAGGTQSVFLGCRSIDVFCTCCSRGCEKDGDSLYCLQSYVIILAGVLFLRIWITPWSHSLSVWRTFFSISLRWRPDSSVLLGALGTVPTAAWPPWFLMRSCPLFHWVPSKRNTVLFLQWNFHVTVCFVPGLGSHTTDHPCCCCTLDFSRVSPFAVCP